MMSYILFFLVLGLSVAVFVMAFILSGKNENISQLHEAIINLKQTFDELDDQLGTGRAHSVLELVHKFEKVTKSVIPYVFADRRNGDISECWADPSKANSQLEWRCEHTLETMIRDSWKWNTLNPKGYK